MVLDTSSKIKSTMEEDEEEILQELEREINDAKEQAKEWGLKDDEIQKCLESVFPPVRSSWTIFSVIWTILSFIIKCIWITCKVSLLFVVIYVLITSHNPTQRFIMRHSQSYIYPFMRQVRLWSLPVVRRYESITDWHEEECLVRNPFYRPPPLDCWPCEDIRTVVDLTGLQNYSKAYCYNERPFIVKDVMDQVVTFQTLQKMYEKNKEELQRGTSKLSSNIPGIFKLKDMFIDTSKQAAVLEKKDTQIVWKVNRVSAARVMRKVFKRPHFVPTTSEVALQRYVFIDGYASSQYPLPYTDFANVWLAQGQGYRLIVLDPSVPCRDNCTTVSVLLKPKDVLYYNWQFWKPRSLPTRLTEEVSITYMGSFY